jgi:hypothetical protein
MKQGEIRKDEDEDLVQMMMKKYPYMDWLMCKAMVSCYKAGTLDKIIEDREKMNWKVEDDIPTNTILKAVDIN